MHPEAYAFVASCRPVVNPQRVLEFGSLDINGSVRDLWNEVADDDYFGIDLQEGPGVDEVADAVSYRAAQPASLVICCEVLEHAPDIRGIVCSAFENLMKEGYFIVTCAAPPRAPHSAVDGGLLRPGEFYSNVAPGQLVKITGETGFKTVQAIHENRRGDLYGLFQKP